jgi:predicted Rossmann-fold nucleotide-binding protein
MRLTIGVMGSNGGDLSEANLAKAHRLGEAIAARDAVLITGGCPGLPYEAVRGAKAKGGLVIGSELKKKLEIPPPSALCPGPGSMIGRRSGGRKGAWVRVDAGVRVN